MCKFGCDYGGYHIRSAASCIDAVSLVAERAVCITYSCAGETVNEFTE